MASTMDDKKVMQQIFSTHSPDASLVVDENALLSIVEDILHHTTPTAFVDAKTNSEVVESKVHQQGVSEALALTIHKIGCELSCSCSGGDVKAITLAVFNSLVKYAWDAKVALVLSAFAVSYGEFSILSQLHASNPIAKSVILLKPLPDISERESLIGSLLEVVIDLTKCVIELHDLPSQYISRDKPPLSEALTHIPIAAYWAIRSIVTCASQSIGLINISHEYVTPIVEVRKKLTDLTQTLKNCHGHLTNQLVLCCKHIDDQINNEAYYNLVRLVESKNDDNIKILKELIHTKDEQPLFDGVNKRKVSVNVLKGKTVILFISYLDISDHEIKEIIQKSTKTQRQYEVVWLPIIDKSVASTDIRNEILRKASMMPWYSLHHSLLPQPAVIRYIKEKWHFEKKPLLVVFNAQGEVVNLNAYHMIITWGNEAFPFNTEREETLWKEAPWSLHFLVDETDVDKERWVKEGSFVCLYGGEDMDWIKKFTTAMKEVAKGAGIALELIYVGKKQAETVIKENLSKYWDDQPKIKRFWDRLESIWYSKMRHGRSISNDKIMKDVMMLLSSDGSDQGWTVIGHGSKDVVIANGKVIMDCLSQFQNLKVKITGESFISTLNNVIKEVQNTRSRDPVHKHCNHLTLPSTTGIIPENMVCVDCNRPMEKYIMYKCCIE
ncbi:hypothetical protein AAC387_Pa02g3641 [Persea americana]